MVLSSVFVTGASALSENARYYESIPDTVYATAGEKFKSYYTNVEENIGNAVQALIKSKYAILNMPNNFIDFSVSAILDFRIIFYL